MTLLEDVLAQVTVIDALTAFGLETPQRGVMRCPLPGHDDNSPSANVRRGKDGKERWHCFVCNTGGDVIDLVAAVFGWEPLKATQLLAREFGILQAETKPSQKYRSHQAPADPQTKHRKAKQTEGVFPVKVESYRYYDEDGTPLFDVVRMEPKSFRQRRVNPDGSLPEDRELRWSMEGVKRVLFRLVELRYAIEKGRMIYVVEGERDVLALMARGFAATTNAGGAGKWQDSYTETLRGADVTVVADKDLAGLAHARSVVAALQGTARSVSLKAPVGGKDIRDHFQAGLEVEDLVSLSETLKRKKRKFSTA